MILFRTCAAAGTRSIVAFRSGGDPPTLKLSRFSAPSGTNPVVPGIQDGAKRSDALRQTNRMTRGARERRASSHFRCGPQDA